MATAASSRCPGPDARAALALIGQARRHRGLPWRRLDHQLGEQPARRPRRAGRAEPGWRDGATGGDWLRLLPPVRGRLAAMTTLTWFALERPNLAPGAGRRGRSQRISPGAAARHSGHGNRCRLEPPGARWRCVLSCGWAAAPRGSRLASRRRNRRALGRSMSRSPRPRPGLPRLGSQFLSGIPGRRVSHQRGRLWQRIQGCAGFCRCGRPGAA